MSPATKNSLLPEAGAPVVPLADRMRPTRLEQLAGQPHLLGADKALRRALESGLLHSMIFWGPPGSGKTTLARIVASASGAEFIALSAVFSGVKEIRNAVDAARQLQAEGKPTVLFVDEVHRFNKAQQDGFLPYVEDGTLTFIGATTENPSFELNKALLSRARVYVLKALTATDIRAVIDRALSDRELGLGKLDLDIAEPLRDLLAQAADGDARRALNLLELAADLADAGQEPQCREAHGSARAATRQGRPVVTEMIVQELITGGVRRFDKGGEVFYDQISALHKAVRGSSPDATLYWLARMLDGGCDPLYVARRVVRMASEDVGNADPRALQLALNAWDVQERLGSPEGELAIAQALVYMACAPKSNAVYTAFGAAMKDAKTQGSLEVPLHLRNAPTALMKEIGYGKDYRYAHDETGGYAAGEHYFPDELGERRYYYPVDRGLEQKIAAKLAQLRELDKQTKKKD